MVVLTHNKLENQRNAPLTLMRTREEGEKAQFSYWNCGLSQTHIHISTGIRRKQSSFLRFNLRLFSSHFPAPFLSFLVHEFFCAVLHSLGAWLLSQNSGLYSIPVRNTGPWERNLHGRPHVLHKALEEFLLLLIHQIHYYFGILPIGPLPEKLAQSGGW